MIITRAPLRISIGGGGTDIPSYYKINDGFLISATINKYIYITVAETFNKKFILKYSKSEVKNNPDSIKHPLFRETIKELNINIPVNISSHSEIPAGSGLGSSGAFTVSLLKALSLFSKKKIGKKRIAELACKIEIENLNEPVGKQDQYSASFGGLRYYKFFKNGQVFNDKLNIKNKNLNIFKKNLGLYYTGILRSSYEILEKQVSETLNVNKDMIKNLDYVKEMGLNIKKILETGDPNEYGHILNDHWKLKKKRSKYMTNKRIDHVYDYALDNGAIGGKIIGAGGGGFFMFWSKNHNKLEKELKKLKIDRLNFHLEDEGVKLLSSY